MPSSPITTHNTQLDDSPRYCFAAFTLSSKVGEEEEEEAPESTCVILMIDMSWIFRARNLVVDESLRIDAKVVRTSGERGMPVEADMLRK